MMLVLTTVALMSSGGLLSERQPPAGMLMGVTELGAPVESMGMSELLAERSRLVTSRPGLGLGLGLTIGGGIGFLVGLSTFLFTNIAAGIVIMLVAAAPLVIGIIVLVGALGARRENAERMHEVELRISQLENGGGGSGRPDSADEVPPPPPPPRPPSAGIPYFEPQLLLASF